MMRTNRLWLMPCAGLVLSLTLSSSASAQIVQVPEPFRRIVQSENVVIAVSQSGKQVHGYSEKTGSFESIQLDVESRAEVTPIVSANIACIAHKSRLYAFSYETGKWADVDLPEPAQPAVHQNRIHVYSGTRLFIYSGITGKWDSVDLADE